MANLKPGSLLLDSFHPWQKPSIGFGLMSSRTPASARADKIFNDPHSWGSGDTLEDLRQSPPFYDDDIYSGTAQSNDIPNDLSSDVMKSKFSTKPAVMPELTLKPFENKFYLQKRPSISSASDSFSSSTFASSTVSSVSSVMDVESLAPVKPKWEGVRDDATNDSPISLSPLLEKTPKLRLESIGGRMSLFWQQQNIFRAIQTPMDFEFDLDSDSGLTPWSPTSDFWKGKRVLDNFEKSMEADKAEPVPLTRLGPKHKRTRTPPSIAPLSISTTTTTTTTTTVLTIHSPIVGTPVSVTTIVSASATWSILELYGASPISPKKSKLPLLPKTSGPLVTTFTLPSPSPKFSRRSSLPKSALAATFGFVDPKDLLRVPEDFPSAKIVELPDDFVVPATVQPKIKAAPEATAMPAPRAQLTVSIPDSKGLQKPKKKPVRPLPKLPRVSSPPPPVPALPNALPVLPPIPKHSPLPLPVTPASSSSASSSSFPSLPKVVPSQQASQSSLIPQLKRPPLPATATASDSLSITPVPSTASPLLDSSLSPASSTTTSTASVETSDMKVRNLFRFSISESKAAKQLTRASTPPPSKTLDSEKAKSLLVPSLPSTVSLVKQSQLPGERIPPSVPIPPVPSVPSAVLLAKQSQLPVEKNVPSPPSDSLTPAALTNTVPNVVAGSDSSQVPAAVISTSSINKPPELELVSASLTSPASSALATSTPSSSRPIFRRLRSPSVSATVSRPTSDHSSPTPRNLPDRAKRQTSLQIAVSDVPFPDVTTLALRRKRSGSLSASTSLGPSISPSPTPQARVPPSSYRKPSIKSPGSLGSRANKGSESVGSTRSSGAPLTDDDPSSSAMLSSSPSKSWKTSPPPLVQPSVTSPPKSDADTMLVRRSPPPSTLQPPAEMGKGMLSSSLTLLTNLHQSYWFYSTDTGMTTVRYHSKVLSATIPPSVPIPPIPSDSDSSLAMKAITQNVTRSPSPAMALPESSIQSGAGLSRSSSKRKNAVSPVPPIPSIDVPFPDAATLARRVTKKESLSSLKPPVPDEPVSGIQNRKRPNLSLDGPIPTIVVTQTIKKKSSFTSSSTDVPVIPPKSIKRVSSTPALRSAGSEEFDPLLPRASLLAKRIMSKGAAPKARPDFEDVHVLPKMPSPSLSSTKSEETVLVPTVSVSRPRAPPLPDIFFKPGTGKDKGKDKENQQDTNIGKGKYTQQEAEKETEPKQIHRKDKGKQKEMIPPVPALPVETDSMASKDSDQEFEKELDKAVSVKSFSTTSSSSSKSKSESKFAVPQSQSSNKARPPAPPLPDIFFKKPFKNEQEPIPGLSKIDAATTKVSVQLSTPSVASTSSQPVSDSTRKRLSTVAPIITDLKRPTQSNTVLPLKTSKHSRSRSLSSTRIPIPTVVSITPPVPRLPVDLSKGKQSLSSDEEKAKTGEEQVVIVKPRRSRSPTRPTTPGGPRFRSRSVASRESDRAGSSLSLDAPLVPPPPLSEIGEGRSGSPTTPGSRGRVSPFPLAPLRRMSIVTAA